MRTGRVLLLSVLMVIFVAFSGGKETTARNVSEQCKADLKAVVGSCKLECAGNLRCFLRCAINNFPESCLP